jgi:uncharacterized membrane protein
MSRELDGSPLTQSQRELEARDKKRLETFIDAVFAIAITLLGLGFVAPVVQHSSGTLVGSLMGIAPKFAGYFLAFALLGIMLNNNWRQFQNITYANWALYFINILFLSFVVLVPFATTVWTTYPDTIAGVLVFHSVIFIAGVILYANWAYVRWRPYLLKKDITGQTLKEIAYRDASLPPASALAIVLAFISPVLSNTAYLFIVVMMAVALHQRRRRLTSQGR